MRGTAASTPPLRERTRAEVRAALAGGEQRYEAAINCRYAASRGAHDNWVEYRVGNRRTPARDVVVWADGSLHDLRCAFAHVRAATAAAADSDTMARFTLVAELAGYAPSLFWSCVTYAAAKTARRSTATYIQALDDVVFDCMAAPPAAPAAPLPASAAQPAPRPLFALPPQMVASRSLAALDAAMLLNDNDDDDFIIAPPAPVQ